MNLAWLLLALTAAPSLGKDLCDEQLRTRVLVGKIRPDGGLQVPDDGSGLVIYPKGTYWREGGSWWACPCQIGTCIRQCKRSLAKKMGFEIARQPSVIEVWHGNRTRKEFFSEFFHIIGESGCASGGYFLEEEIELDEFRILDNGSLHFSHVNVSNDVERTIGVDKFCVIPQVEKVGAFICMPPDPQELKFQIYPVFFVISIVFLLLTLIAFFLTPDHHTIHVRSVVCQSGSLLIAYIGLTVNYTIGDTSHINTCIITAYVTYYFLLASFFWLNVMCIDIYITFSGLLDRANERAFLKFSVYAWCTPLVIFTITVVLDRVTNHADLSPGIGKKTCWFKTISGQLLYFSGPVLIILLVNCYLFCVTALRLWRVKRDVGRALHHEDSKVHGRKAKQQEQDKDRLKLFVKLFLLMGCTWFMEIISWAIGGPSEIWYVTDTINCLRGVLIFWFCVWSNRTIRNQLKERFSSDKKGKKTSIAAPTTSSVFSIASSTKLH